MKSLVIYHANCTDGFGAAFAAWLKLGDEAGYLPMEYNKNPNNYFGGRPIAQWARDTDVYILDFSFPRR